jgi:hypothetical protein
MFFYTHIISNPNPFLTKQLTVNCENEHNKNTTTTEYKSKQEMLVLPFFAIQQNDFVSD